MDDVNPMTKTGETDSGFEPDYKAEFEAAQLMLDQLESQNNILGFRLEMMSDVSRMQAASSILAAMFASEPDGDTGLMVEAAMDVADELISRYDELLEDKARNQQKAVEDMQAGKGEASSGAAN